MLRKQKKPQTPLQKLKMSQIGVREKVKKRKPSDPAKQTLLQLDKTAWEVFAHYIKLRDCEWRDDGFYGQCISCSKKGKVVWHDGKKWRWTPGWDAGHYVSRGQKVVKYDERNVNLQCSMNCNRMKSGNRTPYARALDLKYGDGTAQELDELALTTQYYKFTRPELIGVIESSKEYVSFTLAHPKGLE